MPRLGFYGRVWSSFSLYFGKKVVLNWHFLLICIGLYHSLDFFACNWVVNFVFVFGRLWIWMDFYGKDWVFLDFGKYVVLNGILQFISYSKEKNAILFTYPPVGSFTSTGLVVSSTLPRFSDMYTLTIASADPKSISANKPVKLSKSVTKWFTKDGILVEGLFWKDIEGLVDNYKGDHKNK